MKDRPVPRADVLGLAPARLDDGFYGATPPARKPGPETKENAMGGEDDE